MNLMNSKLCKLLFLSILPILLPRVGLCQWVLIQDSNFSDGSHSDTTFGAAGSRTGAADDGKWIDLNGGVWRIHANQLVGLPNPVLNAFKSDFLLRDPSEQSVGQRVIINTGASTDVAVYPGESVCFKAEQVTIAVSFVP